MRNSILFIILALVFIAFIGSKPSLSLKNITFPSLIHEGEEEKESEKSEDTSGIYNIKLPENFDFYPFNKAARIEVLSYPDRTLWDTIQHGSHKYLNYDIIQNGKLRLDTAMIRERVTLTQEQTDTLQHIFYNVRCDFREINPCYYPRHSIIFYDKDDNAFASFEVSLACLTYNTTKGFSYIDYCFRKNQELESFFLEIGIRYYIQDIENDKLYEWRLKGTEMMKGDSVKV